MSDFAAMQAQMLGATEGDKVFGPVIGAIAIDVMDDLVGFEGPAVGLLPGEPMLEDIAVLNGGRVIRGQHVDIAEHLVPCCSRARIGPAPRIVAMDVEVAWTSCRSASAAASGWQLDNASRGGAPAMSMTPEKARRIIAA